MKKGLFPIAAVLLSMLLTGCLEQSITIQVNKDGSGTIILRELISPELAATEPRLSALYAESVQGADGAATARPFFEELVRERTAQLGPNVRLTFTRETRNARGWKGYQARFAFDDINQVRILPGHLHGGTEEAFGGFSFEFDFSATDDLAMLTAHPIPATARLALDELPQPLDTEADADEFIGEDEPVTDSAPATSLFDGMRVAVHLRVGGTIDATDAPPRSSDHPNAVTLLDIDADRVLGDPEALALVAESDGSVEQLRTLDVDGLILPDPSESLSIEFR